MALRLGLGPPQAVAGSAGLRRRRRRCRGETRESGGIGFARAAAGCDLILHTPAWHGIHTRQRTEVDFWRLNVDGTFWIFQAAAHAGVKRLVFMSSLAWYGH